MNIPRLAINNIGSSSAGSNYHDLVLIKQSEGRKLQDSQQ